MRRGLQIAFEQLDRSVRYATAISEPDPTATTGGAWYVEWSSASGTTTLCSQLRASVDVLVHRLQHHVQ